MSGDSGAAASIGGTGGLDELVAMLRAWDESALDDHDLLELISSCDRLASWAAARQCAAIAEFARRPARIDVAGEALAVRETRYAPLGRVAREYVDEELALQLRTSRVAASIRVSTACGLVRLPATAASLVSGRIDLSRARVIAEELVVLDSATAASVEGDLAERAARLSPARLRERARRVVLDADPVAAQVRATRARTQRRVWFTPLADGMAEIGAVLTAADAVAVRTALGASARALKATACAEGESRTMDQRMADAFVAPFQRALATGVLDGAEPTTLAKHRGQGACVQITAAASTLLGHDDASVVLEGYGPVTSDVARDLAPDARWRRVLTDPRSGVVLDVGTTVYRPPVALDRFVKVRAQRCCFPGCGWPAVACEVDHCVPYPSGPTAADNHRPFCARHHHLKHSPGVRIVAGPDGATRWIMPTGHVHDAEAPAVGRRVSTRAMEPDDRRAMEPDDTIGAWDLVDDDESIWWDDTG